MFQVTDLDLPMPATAAPVEYGLTTLAMLPITAPPNKTNTPVRTSYPAVTPQWNQYQCVWREFFP